MALTFPLPLADFLDLLPVAGVSFDLGEAMQSDETGGGELLVAELGARLWEGRVVLGAMDYREAQDAAALIDLIRAPGRSFLLADLRRRGPASDPAGTVLSAFNPFGPTRLANTQSGGREIVLTGLPASFVLSRGDRLAFDYGSPARCAWHRIVTGNTADSFGDSTGWMEVVPPIRPGVTGTPTVTLLRPALRAVYRPGSWQPGETRDRLVTGASFGWVQQLAGLA
ncbi:MAG: hypothetical protein KF887_07140 [Paracoccaceae bacterium]|nr:MAG: hypothetical protein KF887_07140 [Paracoccaceae bacterium]